MAWFHGEFHWNELMTHDVERAKNFYQATMGWEFERLPGGSDISYWIIKMDKHAVGGLFEMKGPDFASMAEQWVPYLSVDNIDARLEKATKAGARLMKPPFDVPGFGRIALLREPGGAMIGWMTPSDK